MSGPRNWQAETERTLQRVWREKMAMTKGQYKRPSDNRVDGVVDDLIKLHGFDGAMNCAHTYRTECDPVLHKNRNLTFGIDFWSRVIAALHARGRNGGRS